MKKLFAALLAGLMFSLAGCASSNGAASADSSSEAPAPSQEAPSSEPSSQADDTPVELPAFSGLDPAASLSDEELAATVKAAYEGNGEFTPDKLPTAVIETSMGTIKIRLFPQFAPKAVENFIGHAKNGYYDNTKFHRVVKDFMIQGGDPKGDSTGGTSIWNESFEDEFNDILHNFRGAISMANAGANTNGSQFFIVQNNQPTTADTWEQLLPTIYMQRQVYEAYARLLPMTKGREPQAVQEDPAVEKAMDSLNAELSAKEDAGLPDGYAARMEPVRAIYEQVGGAPFLDNKHTVFGYVYEGMDVVDAIAAVEVNGEAPKDDIVIKKITVTEPDGASAASSAEASSGGEASSAASASQAPAA